MTPLTTCCSLRTSGDFVTHVTAWQELPARPPRWAPLPPRLDPRLAALLAGRGIARLYSHQARAVTRRWTAATWW